jgi:acyl-CoA thioesterase YciA
MSSANPHEHDLPAIRVIMMPRDTNPAGTIFGGVLLSYMDQAGAIEARKHGPYLFVTVAMDRVVFKEPVHVGDLLSFYAQTLHRGTTSVRVKVSVVAERFIEPRCIIPVTEAEMVFVAVDDNRRPTPLGPPGVK